MDYNKLSNESNFDYKMRLICGKLDKELDLDWSEIVSLLDLDISADHLRKISYGMYDVYTHMKENEKNKLSDDILSQLDEKNIEIKKERTKLTDQRASFNKTIRGIARWEDLQETIEKTISSKLPILNFKKEKISHNDKDLMVSLNDLHFGANINNAWNIYNSDICAERLNYYINEILEIQKNHGAENCYVCANGDLINGNIHIPVMVSNKENLIEQIMGVSELISMFLLELCKHFNNVVFTVVAGNHSRLGTKDDSLKGERLDDLIPWFVKARLQNIDNLIINNNLDNTMSLVDIRGKKYLQVHGDYEKGNAAFQAVALMGGDNIYAICCGHLHHNSIDNVNNIKIIMAGSFLGVDDFCISKRIIGKPQQLVSVCDNTGIKCFYDINF